MNQTYRVEPSLCEGCGHCVDVCDEGAIRLAGELATIDPQRCTGCGACAEACPEKAIYAVIEVEAEYLPSTAGTAAYPATTPTGTVQLERDRHPTLITRLWRSPGVKALATFLGGEVMPRALDALFARWEGQEATESSGTSTDLQRASGTGLGGQARHRHRRGQKRG